MLDPNIPYTWMNVNGMPKCVIVHIRCVINICLILLSVSDSIFFSSHCCHLQSSYLSAYVFFLTFWIYCSNCEVYLTVYLQYVICNKDGFTALSYFSVSYFRAPPCLFWVSLLCLSCSLPLGETHLRVNDIHRQGDHLTVNISDLVSCQHLPDMQHHITSHHIRQEEFPHNPSRSYYIELSNAVIIYFLICIRFSVNLLLPSISSHCSFF